MLDKSVPHVVFYMRREAGPPPAKSTLPNGFGFSLYGDGDDQSWAVIETSVLEFDSEFAALMHFKEKFAPYPDELSRRCLFIENCDGRKVATATAWWSIVEGQRRPWLQWVGVDPEFQGLGLGKALISRATELLIELEGEGPLFLKTQTWSYKAVNIYRACGFEPTDEKLLYRNKKDNYKKAMRILEKVSKRR